MKSNTNHKKHAAPVRASKEEPEKEVQEEAPAVPAGRKARSRQRPGAIPGVQGSVELQKTRLALIKARHEAMKREIDQIREDLESDEDE
jgi:hypothetical protein